MQNKPDTLRANPIKEWIRIQFLSPYLWDIPADQKTLDLACGWGFSFKINPNFYGVEFDNNCCEYLKKQNYKVTQGSILGDLPFENNFFDNAFSHDVLEHFELSEIPTIFKNVNRVLKPNGKFINIVPNHKGYDFGLKINAGHKHYILPSEIHQIAEQTGFKVLKTYSSPLPEFLCEAFTHNKWVVMCEKL